jgi:chaperonin GroEL (HSP60 family)
MIARRIISLQNRDEVATATVRFQTVFNQGLKYIAANCSPMTFRHHLERGANIIVNALDDLTQPIAGTQVMIR